MDSLMDAKTIEGTVSSIVFQNHENGYAILKLNTEDGFVTVAGCIPGLLLGDRYEFCGKWVTHPQYGEQFKSESFTLKPQSGEDEVRDYLASGAIKHIGPSKARDIVDKFGAESLKIIENEPEKLAEIRGISRKIALKIGDDWRRTAMLRRLIEFLAHYKVKPVVAARVYKIYGDESLEAVRHNPYIISSGEFGADFNEADTIALDLGFESDCTERVSAALIFILSHNLNNGHVFIPKAKLTAAADEMIGVGFEAIDEAMEALCECGDIVVEEIAGENACYLRQMHEAEYYTATRISDMASLSSVLDKSSFNSNALIEEIQREHGIEYAENQKQALKFVSENGVMALTGGPGTGKTTTVRGIIKLFDEMGLKTVLCAPTGRAAKRLSEVCQREAATIHRMLGAQLGEDGELEFSYNEINPLNADAVIVDEVSMVDISLMSSLLSAIKRKSRLVLVGDADQLPSVGPGNVFSDIIKSGTVPTVMLTEIFRQAKKSGIVRSAHNVNAGIVPDLTEKYPDIFFMRRLEEEKLAETVTELISERLPKNMGIDSSQIQVLSPTKKREAGTISLNERLREAINPRHALKKEKQYGGFLFRTGDKVMQIKNNYDIIWRSIDNLVEGTGVFNGDVGRVTEISHEKEIVTVDFEDKLVNYQFDQLAELEPAFAMTVHKSQGSEYNAVILAMTSAAPQLLTRSILYTAMTRAKNLLIIVGNPEIMEKMVNNDKRQRRYSGLRARLSL